MKRAFVLLVVLSANAMAQEAQPDLKLTELERTKWENIQLKGEQLNAAFKIDEYNKQMEVLKKQLADLGKGALDSRNLDTKEYEFASTNSGPLIRKKPAETAKK